MQAASSMYTPLCMYKRAVDGCRGVPVDRYTRLETVAAYWIFGLFWGKAVSQNKKGHLIGHIKVRCRPSSRHSAIHAVLKKPVSHICAKFHA